jgi:hypothetical protein
MTQETQPVKRKKGGPQPGSGRPKGRLNQSTLEAMAVKKEYQDKIRRNAEKLFTAQMSLASGVQMLFVIHTDSKGQRRKPEMITDPDTINRFLEENEGVDGTLKSDEKKKSPKSKVEDYYFLTTKIPDSRTISDMLDRAFGKADATLDVTSGGNAIKGATITFEDSPEPED